ncbi:hypothetical protein GUITHDRAFT_115430 [Guillardia theta CCMP2712]|uniref:Uncharacterized protein n=1 Tax=Guillardia theta (strain CCMP2712) TaxID=905079 RepID=L1IRD4_GUITC|nr:hypothetical protein GUITHDRAFT_115430 [Guillardia theta CCMP2712]EKX38464.1 hypothetical protein GUITHDRAFT_115430 [Guillardia theta CCMP2712]|eukprot:XP_005825444.1 hypothetical protein GUITHDRAFT_115430 [Guillardia theta CCMP2712]
MFQTVAQFQELYYYRPWAKTQNEGYADHMYMRKLFWDHSFAYDDSYYQDPPAHKHQSVSYNAYADRKDYLKILNAYGTGCASSHCY